MRHETVPSLRALVALIGLALLGWTASAAAQDSTPAPRQPRGWRVSASFRLGAEYDDNVFLLDAGRKDAVASPTAAEVASGRYADMDDAADLVTTLGAALELKRPGLSGRTLTITPAAAYELYARNSARSNVVLGLSFEQDLPRSSRLRLLGRVSPEHFTKNYLADAVDGDLNGSISDAERRYDAGEYREAEASLDYRFRVAKSTRDHRFGASLQLGAGYYDRAYAEPFGGRDLAGPTAEARALLTLSRRVSADVTYGFASLSGDPADQVVLLDEADFGEDFNGNGNSIDPDVRVVTLVDRSRTEHSLGGEVRFEVSRRVDLDVGYEHRWRSYSSDEPLDVTHLDRRDSRDRFGAELGMRLSPRVKLRLGGEVASQDTNRPGDPGAADDTSDYTRFRAGLGLTYAL
jgi:hypothetical protein